MQENAFDAVVMLALAEDLCKDFSEGFEALRAGRTVSFTDVTSDALFRDEEAHVKVHAKSKGVLSGSRPFSRVFDIVYPALSVSFSVRDGHPFSAGDTVASLHGNMHAILAGERTALNFLGHLSGIATTVRDLCVLLEGTGVRILDTRKTLPGLRFLEKEAVMHGGGTNHRMGLFDMVLIKDNHIDRAGSIEGAVQAVRNRHGRRYAIEVETRTLEEVSEAVRAGVDRIMLDNMDVSMVEKACAIIDGSVEIEVSGNMNREKIMSLRHLPIDFISMGAITYAADHADFSMTLGR